jgi:phosphoenolpyruvate-protein phosphotransferase (PTS system enzyme I)
MLARARGVPMAVGLGEAPESGEGVLDGEAGLLIVRPEPATRERYARRLDERRRGDAEASAQHARPAVTGSGERVEVMLNIDDPTAVHDGLLDACDGVGLFRTEFLFLGRPDLPGEGEQLLAYGKLLDRLRGKPCIVRTLDVGGDKPLSGVSLPAESNPFLGLRGLRLCLERPELFRPQVRALLRAAALGPLKVMLPMVATAAEVEETSAVFAACLAELDAEHKRARMPPLGIMVETPAAAVAIDLIPADFYSIGSNDLTQYVMAASRDAGGRVAALNDPLHPAVLRLVRQIVRHGQASGVPVSLCGDMASDPAGVDALLGLGLRRLSVAPAALGRVKLAVSRFRGA